MSDLTVPLVMNNLAEKDENTDKLNTVSECLTYRISSVIRRVFFSFQNNPKVLDPSCKTDLELWHCLGRVELVL